MTTVIERQSEFRSTIGSIWSRVQQADSIAAETSLIAVRRATRETGLPPARFPTKWPQTVAAALAFNSLETHAKRQPPSVNLDRRIV